MVDINRGSTCVSSVTYDDLYTLKIYEEVSGDAISKWKHQNWCILCYRILKIVLSRFYFY